jgi:hypothetical protein
VASPSPIRPAVEANSLLSSDLRSVFISEGDGDG